MKKVIVIGGGLAGLIAAIRIARAHIPCLLLEKKNYPFHRVCGEYISNETLDFLKREALFPAFMNPPSISRLQLSSVNGQSINLDLDMGGFGLSRYVFDDFLSQQAIAAGVEIIHKEVDAVNFDDQSNTFELISGQQLFTADFVIGAFGKRSKLDVALNRTFIKKRSPYIGVKYHIRYNHPDSLIALHNFNGGYCGISNIEDGKTNLCYLAHRDAVREFKSISLFEENRLKKNPWLHSIFSNAEFLFEKPEVINEISFDRKEPVLNHILMVGDSAGMIAPLCGNGMAMAIHSGFLVSEILIHGLKQNASNHQIEEIYTSRWKKLFLKRLWAGRLIQHYLFGSAWSSRVAVNLAIHSKSISNLIIRNTHGETF